MTKSTAAIHVI